jgi:hypothetical protein
MVVDIVERLNEFELHMEAIPPEKWPELIGEDATEALNKNWADAILRGMKEGSITVGDPRLADILYKIGQSVMETVVDQETAMAKFVQLKEEGYESATPESFWRAVLGIERIDLDAIQAGLTTPGQELYALPRRASLPGL